MTLPDAKSSYNLFVLGALKVTTVALSTFVLVFYQGIIGDKSNNFNWYL